MICQLWGIESEMCSFKVAIFTGGLLQAKTFVLYPHRYDHEGLLGGSIDVFQGFVNKVFKTFQICIHSHSYEVST